ncbi:sensor histidine kinase N-terminal domain-containing protein [Roseibium sp.]|uniref:sensor histidine kinase N-terminal domain-containing protein n=1 Tax=Roseibium sp. TaxID=1936156 RepID=UPI003A97AEB7
MTTQATSLRIRLLVLILVPLVLISTIAGYWRFEVARGTSEYLFDRTLVAVTMAISRDVIIKEGDALTPATLDLLRSSSGGGKLFYHVNGPDGVFVTGYAYPPTPPPDVRGQANTPVLFEATYRSEGVRVARLTEYLTLGGVSGFATVTVWQNMAAREAFARNLAIRAALLMGSLILTVAAVVWFGISLGLRPLQNLEQAISIRSPSDMDVIRRPVPPEVSGIVKTLNALFGQVASAIASRDVFISNAAHQLRNPIASILTMATAARDAHTDEDRKLRSEELVEAARHASRLTEQLLSYERARGPVGSRKFVPTVAADLARDVCTRSAKAVLERDVDFTFKDTSEGAHVLADPVMLEEALQNLIDNALAHAGPSLSWIEVVIETGENTVAIRVTNNGVSLSAADLQIAFERFGQVTTSEGTGLGLPIVREIMTQHGGSVETPAMENGACFRLVLPRHESQAPA